MRRLFHWCQKFGKVKEGFNDCECQDKLFPQSNPTFGLIPPTYDPGLGEVVTSLKQRYKLMKKQKVVDVRDAPSKNPLVIAALDKWKWRHKHGLT